METLLKEILERIIHIENTMATKKDVADIPFIRQAVLELREDIKELKVSQERIIKVQVEQQKVIEVLSVRTTEHEAKLKFA